MVPNVRVDDFFERHSTQFYTARACWFRRFCAISGTMDRAWLNKINRELRIDPELALRKLRTMAEHDFALSADPNTSACRPRALKRDREIRQACLFCCGMSARIGQPVWVYPIEELDFDFVAAWEVGKNRHFAPTQLKEVVPENLNPKASLQSVIDHLVDYRASQQLTVAIYLNRGAAHFELKDIVLPVLELAALWVFAATSEDQSHWYLFGNMLEEPTYTFFDYPV
jgi:hypothetical protein